MSEREHKRVNIYANAAKHDELSALAKQRGLSASHLYDVAITNLLNDANGNIETLYNRDIEKTILSSLIFNPIDIEKVKSKIKVEDFSVYFYQHIYEAMLHLYDKEVPIDEEFVKKVMIQRKQWNEIEFLDLLAANPITNIDPYLDDILEQSIKRKLNLFLLRSRSILLDEELNPFQFKTELIQQLEAFKDSRASLVSPQSILDVEGKEIDFFTEDWIPIPKNLLTIIAGNGGVAKSATVLQLLMRILKEDPTQKVFAWLSEDPASYTKQRFEGFLRVFFRNEHKEIFKNLNIAGNDEIPFFLLNITSRGIEVNDEFYKFKKEMKDYDVIVLDPLIGFFGGEENNNTHARKFMNLLNEWASKEEKTIILIHHSKKPGGNYTRNESKVRGAGAILDSSRLTYEIKSVTIDDYKEDYQLFTGSKYNAFEPKNIEEKGSDGYGNAIDAIMTHRRVLIAKENLGVSLMMEKRLNKDKIFYIKAWGERQNHEIIIEDAPGKQKLLSDDDDFLSSDVVIDI